MALVTKMTEIEFVFLDLFISCFINLSFIENVCFQGTRDKLLLYLLQEGLVFSKSGSINLYLKIPKPLLFLIEEAFDCRMRRIFFAVFVHPGIFIWLGVRASNSTCQSSHFF